MKRERGGERQRDVGCGVRWGAGGGERCAPGDARAGGADGVEDSQTQAGKCRGSALPARAGGWRCAGGWEAQKAGAWDGPQCACSFAAIPTVTVFLFKECLRPNLIT